MRDAQHVNDTNEVNVDIEALVDLETDDHIVGGADPSTGVVYA